MAGLSHHLPLPSALKNKLLDSDDLRKWTKVHRSRNLLCLLLDFLSAAGIITSTIYFLNHRAEWGLPWIFNIPVTAIAIFLVGCIQHRIGLMGHEASHYLLHPNRRTNDLLAQILCFFPVFGSLPNYRAKHLTHHLHPNDPDRDMNLHGDRAKRLYSRFPMEKPSFIFHYYLKFFWPPFVLSNLRDLIHVIAIGSPEGKQESGSQDAGQKTPLYRKPALWGIAYLIAYLVVMEFTKRESLPIFAVALSSTYLLGVLGWSRMPDFWFLSKRGKLAYPHRIDALLRMTFVTALATSFGITFRLTGVWAGGYFLLLWVVPLIYVFPYLMLLREIYQHANADEGDLTNSRMMFTDPFTRWAVLGYGNGAHLVHHIYPNIPQYHLSEVHIRLLENSEAYETAAEEIYGILRPWSENQPSLLDALSDQETQRAQDSA